MSWQTHRIEHAIVNILKNNSISQLKLKTTDSKPIPSEAQWSIYSETVDMPSKAQNPIPNTPKLIPLEAHWSIWYSYVQH